jgi:small subunit ribosomal protein S21
MAEVRLQERESLENALRRFKRKVMTEDIIKGCEAPLLLSKARRKTPGETSFGTKTCPKKDSQGFGSSCTKEGRCCQVAPCRHLRARIKTGADSSARREPPLR